MIGARGPAQGKAAPECGEPPARLPGLAARSLEGEERHQRWARAKGNSAVVRPRHAAQPEGPAVALSQGQVKIISC